MLEVDNNNFKKEVLESNIPVIVDFWAEWCGPCRMMAPSFEEASNDFAGKIKFAKLNIEEEGNSEIAEQYDIRGIPCLILFHKGKEIERIVGFTPASSLKEKITAVLNKIK